MFWGSKKDDDAKKQAPAQPAKKEAPPERPKARLTPEQQAPAPPPKTPVVARDELPLFLITEGHISEDQIRAALKKQAETGVFFGEILADEGILGNESLVSFLAKHCRIPHIGLLDYVIDKSLISLIPEDICWKYHLLPVDKLGRNLTIAMVNPLNNKAVQAVAALCPELRIKPILCSHTHFETVAQKLFGKHVEHDEKDWAEVPVADSPTPPEAAPEAAPEATPEAAPAQPEKETMDSNGLLDSVFGGVKSPAADAPEADATPPPSDQPAPVASLMHSYTDAMVNSMHDTYELLARKIKFFNGLKPEEVAKIFAQGHVVEHEQTTMLFDKGDDGDAMYVILNGRVKIRAGSKQIAILRTGDIFGEMALASDEPRSATAITMTQSDLLALSLEDIRNNLPAHVSIQLLINIIVTLAERLRLANQE